MLYSKTCKSCVSGNWNSASTWFPEGVPVCGDSVVILASHNVSVTTQQNYSSCSSPIKMAIYGNLKFFNGSKLRLPCNSYIIVFDNGVVEADVGLSNSNFIEICGVVEWNSNSRMTGLSCIPESHPYCSSILPIELAYFKAESCSTSKICFNWETSTEINTHHYEIERSNDAIDFKTIYYLPSKAPSGNSHYAITYNGIDISPLNGINYYRLKQVDNDSSQVYSKVISLNSITDQGIQFLIYPNYNSGAFTAQINGLLKGGNLIVLLRNASGAIVHKGLYHIESVFSEIKVVPEFKLEDGLYFCSFIIDDEEFIVKVLVEND